MAETAFSATGVSVTQDWTTLTTISLDENHTAQALVFELLVDAGSAAELSGVKVQARDHDSATWHDFLGGRAINPLSASVTTDPTPPPPTIRPGHRAHYSVPVSPQHRLRIQAKALDSTATVDIYGFAETFNPVAGDVYGPVSAIVNALVRMADTGGKLITGSGVTLDNSEQMEFGGGRVRNAGVVEVLGSPPPTPAVGMLWYDTSGSAGVGGVVAITTKTGTYTAANTDTVILCDASGGAFTVTLPAAADNTGKVFYLKKIDSSANAVTIDGNGAETIDDATTLVLSGQYDAAMLVSDGAEWWIL